MAVDSTVEARHLEVRHCDTEDLVNASCKFFFPVVVCVFIFYLEEVQNDDDRE